jgi:hypothetical protein
LDESGVAAVALIQQSAQGHPFGDGDAAILQQLLEAL